MKKNNKTNRRYTIIGGKRIYNTKELFLEKVNKTDTCWLWTASRYTSGYGQFQSSGGKLTGAHRFSYILHYGEIPKGMVVMHKCDVKLCVNPDHLSIGTTLDNMRDMYSKGRHRSIETYKKQLGEKNWNSSLSNSQARSIKIEYKTGDVTQASLARKYGVSKSVIRNVVRGRTYAKV